MSSRSPLKTETLRILKERGVPVGTVIDVGIHSGTSELISTWPRKSIYSLNPSRNLLRLLKKLIPALIMSCTIRPYLIFKGTVGLELRSVIQGLPISHSMMTERASAGDGKVIRQVPMIALIDFLQDREYPEPFLLKIDIDGYELKVLRGAKNTLPRCSIVIVECPKSQLVERISAVQEAGFILFDLTEPCYYDKAFWQCDGVFLRADLHEKYFQQLVGSVDQEKYEMFR